MRIIDFECDTDTQEEFKFIYEKQIIVGLIREKNIHYTRFSSDNYSNNSSNRMEFIREIRATDIYNRPVVYKELIEFRIREWSISGDIYNKFNEEHG